MIIGANDRAAVIENIRLAAESGDFYQKAELNDPVLSESEKSAVTSSYIKNRGRFSFRLKSFIARGMADVATAFVNYDTVICGGEKLKPLKGVGAVITSNHFSPFENTAVRKLVNNTCKGRLDIVSQAENFRMPGVIGFLMNYADTVPITDDREYLQHEFPEVLKEKLSRGDKVLIYPEQEMWFNYRKPRPGKRGAYYYAAKLNAPVISCFVEMRNKPKKDTDDFYKVQYVMHVLGVLWPDKEKTARENSVEMLKKDNDLKRAAYERAYGKPLDYGFDADDIAGLVSYPLTGSDKK